MRKYMNKKIDKKYILKVNSNYMKMKLRTKLQLQVMYKEMKSVE